MLELIIGAKGVGKTRKMVEIANNENKMASGTILYLDKHNKHLYELSNSITFINLHDMNISTKEGFTGFVKGLLCSDKSLTHVFLDNFMNLANIGEDELSEVLDEMDGLSEKYGVTFVISTAVLEERVPQKYAASIVCRL